MKKKNKIKTTKFYNENNNKIRVWDYFKEGNPWVVWLWDWEPYIVVKKPAIWKVILTDCGTDEEEINYLKDCWYQFIWKKYLVTVKTIEKWIYSYVKETWNHELSVGTHDWLFVNWKGTVKIKNSTIKNNFINKIKKR